MDKKEINRLIAEKIMGWEAYSNLNFTVWREKEEKDNWHGFVDDFNPVENIADAWKVVDKLRLTVSRIFDGYEIFHANASSSGRGNQYIGTTNNQEWVTDKTAPLAICRFALNTLGISLSTVNE